MSFIDAYRGCFGGVEPICRVLSAHGYRIAPSTYYAAKTRPRSTRAVRDEYLRKRIREVFEDNYGVYGAHKIWVQLNRQGVEVARCTVERLMRAEGIRGVLRGKKITTTARDPDHEQAGDLLDRDFTAARPNAAWVADFTHVPAWCGTVYVAFVVDVFSRVIVGWAAATSKHTDLVLGALEMAIWRRDQDGQPIRPGLIHHSDAGSQYTSFRFTTHLLDAGIDASVGSVGDALDNALMESAIGLYKTELIKPRGPWRTLADVELATAEWVGWYNTERIHTEIGDIPPAEYEADYYAQQQPDTEAGTNN